MSERVNVKLINYQLGLITKKKWFAVLRHKSYIFIPNIRVRYNLLPEVIECLERNGYKVTHIPIIRVTKFRIGPSVWIIEWV